MIVGQMNVGLLNATRQKFPTICKHNFATKLFLKIKNFTVVKKLKFK
jgi:hypothetical protein